MAGMQGIPVKDGPAIWVAFQNSCSSRTRTLSPASSAATITDKHRNAGFVLFSTELNSCS